MSGSVEGAKDIAKDEAKTSPAELLKKAVAGKPEPKAAAEVKPTAATVPAGTPFRIDARLAAVAAVALVIGTGFGLVSAPRERSGEALTRIEAGLDAGRTEASRLEAEIERLAKGLAALRETAEGTRGDVRSGASTLANRMTRLEQDLDKKFAGLTERVARAEPSAPAMSVEKPIAAPVAPPPAPVAAAPRVEPTQTASISDTKPKTETVETWALRDVYDGVAMLEDRKRRLLEVARGDSVPGLGRVESIERRGRGWVVVTKQGVIAPQTW